MTSPVKVCCPVHGMMALTAEQYRLQLDRPETPWFCPKCLASAVLVPDDVGTTRADAAPPQPERLTPEQHRQRHVQLHAMLDELVADYLTQHQRALPSTTPLLALMVWAHEQTITPTEPQ